MHDFALICYIYLEKIKFAPIYNYLVKNYTFRFVENNPHLYTYFINNFTFSIFPKI